ncbi:MAG: phosphoribosyltransferase family protein [Bacteriovorax sp.]|jgi:putative phosphoribosyl transferase
MVFVNRKQAGMLLAEKLSAIALDRKNTVVIAVPRGGVPLGYEIAKSLSIPLDIILVKKIGAPHYPELAVGSVSEDNEIFYNHELLDELGLSAKSVESIKILAVKKLQEIGAELREGNPPLPLTGKDIILVDDGIATGATIEVVLQVLKKRKVRSITIATPVASAETVEKLYKQVDRVVVLSTPHPLYSVGEWYLDFTQVETDEAIELLKEISLKKTIDRNLYSNNEELR